MGRPGHKSPTPSFRTDRGNAAGVKIATRRPEARQRSCSELLWPSPASKGGRRRERVLSSAHLPLPARSVPYSCWTVQTIILPPCRCPKVCCVSRRWLLVAGCVFELITLAKGPAMSIGDSHTDPREQRSCRCSRSERLHTGNRPRKSSLVFSGIFHWMLSGIFQRTLMCSMASSEGSSLFSCGLSLEFPSGCSLEFSDGFSLL